MRWHEPDDARVSSPESVRGSGCNPPGLLGNSPGLLGKTRPFVSRSHGSFRQLRTCRNVDAGRQWAITGLMYCSKKHRYSTRLTRSLFPRRAFGPWPDSFTSASLQVRPTRVPNSRLVQAYASRQT